MNRPLIVCLCGSTRFREAFEEANFNETMAGNIVLSVGCFKLPDGQTPFTHAQKAALDELHFRKIELADRIHFLNVGGYIGESTARELAYSSFLGKPYSFLDEQAGEDYTSSHAHELAQHFPGFTRIERPAVRNLGERYGRAFPEGRSSGPPLVVPLSGLEAPWKDGRAMQWQFSAPTQVDFFEVESPSGFLNSITVGTEEQFLSDPIPLVTITQKDVDGKFKLGPLHLPTIERHMLLRVSTSGFDGRIRPQGRQLKGGR